MLSLFPPFHFFSMFFLFSFFPLPPLLPSLPPPPPLSLFLSSSRSPLPLVRPSSVLLVNCFSLSFSFSYSLSVNLWYRDGHCTRFLRLPDSTSGHILVTNFPLCALSVLWSSVEFGDLLLGSSKTVVRVSSVTFLTFFLAVSVSLSVFLSLSYSFSLSPSRPLSPSCSLSLSLCPSPPLLPSSPFRFDGRFWTHFRPRWATKFHAQFAQKWIT